MKKLKKPNREQRQFLISERLDPKDFQVERATPKLYVFYNKHTEALWEYDRVRGVWLYE